ncbi:uncharacterized protein EDB91DRAFT_208058 [Suillus paluster]|uniref:uncharacterized protein n=1 Tax=Suillus paluster TaxID=48578 RepID=UPI001B878E01|nr:uncharacterized protein EDB91DRAFT_208058 [Suillus paluster]KAG1744041.1 hypothetical protein EDB91DRAFT_208058 [Suillus paluster]
MAFGLLSLPTELICHILLLLTPKDICCCAIACKTLRDVAQSTVHVQYKLELYAQGFTETATLDSIADISIKMTSLKKMGLLWRSGFHLNTVFEETVALPGLRYSWPQFMKCGLWWMPSGEDRRLFIRDCKTNAKSSQTWLQHDLPQYTFVIVDPLQDLKVVFSVCLGHTVTDTEQDRPFIWMSFGLVR